MEKGDLPEKQLETVVVVHGEKSTNDDEDEWSRLWRRILLIAAITIAAIAVPVGITLSLRQDDDCRSKESIYNITLVTYREIPEVYKNNNMSRIDLSGQSTDSWQINELDRGYHIQFGDWWIQKAIRMEESFSGGDDDDMTVKVLFHNEMEFSEILNTIFRTNETAVPVCQPKIASQKIHVHYGESDVFDLGQCNVTRLDSTDEFAVDIMEATFRGKIIVERL